MGEVSGALERVMMKLGGKPIKATEAEKILSLPEGNIKKIHSDGYHYDREVSPGVVKTQILIGKFK